MQDLENNMDDLFRKAVENYQVNSGKSNWDKIVPQLDVQASPAIKKNAHNGRKYRVLALLLILMMLGGGMLVKFNNEVPASTNNPSDIVSNDSDKQAKDNVQKMIDDKTSNPIQHLSLQQKKRTENGFVFDMKTQTINGISDGFYQNDINQLTATQNNTINKNTSSINDQEALINQQNSDKTEQEKLISSVNNYEDTLPGSDVSTSKKINSFNKQHGVYFGLITGISLNKVKSQKLDKPGFDIGVLVGYNFSNKLAVETELSFSKKYYFTEGKYFSMEKIKASMPAEMKVMSVDGSSMLFSIPLKFKYNISNKNKSAFFSTAGLSSYLLTQEKNDYHTLMNGTNEIVTSSYKNSTSYFASSVDFSLGYEHAIGNQNNKIRIEPYVQIPLKKIGVGALPVMSAGLHLGVTLSPH